jgi:hypothetical protein
LSRFSVLSPGSSLAAVSSSRTVPEATALASNPETAASMCPIARSTVVTGPWLKKPTVFPAQSGTNCRNVALAILLRRPVAVPAAEFVEAVKTGEALLDAEWERSSSAALSRASLEQFVSATGHSTLGFAVENASDDLTTFTCPIGQFRRTVTDLWGIGSFPQLNDPHSPGVLYFNQGHCSVMVQLEGKRNWLDVPSSNPVHIGLPWSKLCSASLGVTMVFTADFLASVHLPRMHSRIEELWTPFRGKHDLFAAASIAKGQTPPVFMLAVWVSHAWIRVLAHARKKGNGARVDAIEKNVPPIALNPNFLHEIAQSRLESAPKGEGALLETVIACFIEVLAVRVPRM